jgi:hypothetical protein
VTYDNEGPKSERMETRKELSLTPESRDVLEKLIAVQLVKKFPAFD